MLLSSGYFIVTVLLLHDLFDTLTRKYKLATPARAVELLNQDQTVVIDVREPHELQISRLPGAVNIPLGSLAARLSELDSARDLVVFCKGGTRSARALELLVSAGFKKVKNLKGGINAWAKDVDERLPIY